MVDFLEMLLKEHIYRMQFDTLYTHFKYLSMIKILNETDKTSSSNKLSNQ